MRTISRALLAVSLAGPAAAQAADLDYDFLRGPEYDQPAAVAAIDWSGVYFGGHGGYSTTDFNFGTAGRSQIQQILRNTEIEQQYHVSTWNTLPSRRGHDASFGVFGGYNIQLDNIVLGIEADYTSANQKAYSTDELGRSVTLSSGTYADTYVNTAARATLQDYGTIRARAGVAYGQFLPFVTGGVAVGRALVGSTVDVSESEFTDNTRKTFTGGLFRSAGGPLYNGALKEKFSLGAAIGGGLDVSITQNVFLRAEYQYIWFNPFGDFKMSVNSVRGALGVKF